MVCVAQRGHCKPRLPGNTDRLFGRLAGDHLPVSPLTIEDQNRAILLHLPDMPVRMQHTQPDILKIMRQHADAMAVMAAEIGHHQMVSNNLCFLFTAAGSLKDVLDIPTQILMVFLHDTFSAGSAYSGYCRADDNRPLIDRREIACHSPAL